TVDYSTGRGNTTTGQPTTLGYFSTFSNGTVVSRLWIPRPGSSQSAEHDLTYAFDVETFVRTTVQNLTFD
ncbi:MAG: hypothetical protein AAGM22_24630, partial [Acidobacteriota bacterium]